MIYISFIYVYTYIPDRHACLALYLTKPQSVSPKRERKKTIHSYFHTNIYIYINLSCWWRYFTQKAQPCMYVVLASIVSSSFLQSLVFLAVFALSFQVSAVTRFLRNLSFQESCVSSCYLNSFHDIWALIGLKSCKWYILSF